jgi:hypothetical protein
VQPGLLGRGSLRGRLWSSARWLTRAHSTSVLSLARGGAQYLTRRSTLDTSCVNDADDEGRIVCAAFDGIATHVLAIDPDTGAIAPIGTLTGRFQPEQGTTPGWIAGWWNGCAAALRLATRDAIVPATADDDDSLTVAATDAVLATAGYGTHTSTVRVYSLPSRGR